MSTNVLEARTCEVEGATRHVTVYKAILQITAIISGPLTLLLRNNAEAAGPVGYIKGSCGRRHNSEQQNCYWNVLIFVSLAKYSKAIPVTDRGVP
jgi:hypothetical protein